MQSLNNLKEYLCFLFIFNNFFAKDVKKKEDTIYSTEKKN